MGGFAIAATPYSDLKTALGRIGSFLLLWRPGRQR
jgi:hypothetical protein